MNSKEMLSDIFNFSTSAPIPRWEFAYWYDTIMRWYDEGLPGNHPPTMSGAVQFMCGDICPGYDYWNDGVGPDHDIRQYFGFDEKIHVVAVNTSLKPGYDEEIYKEDAYKITYKRRDGKTVETTKDGTSMPHFLDYPVKTAEDFKRFKNHFNPEDPARLAAPASSYADRYTGRTFPLQLGAGNFAGFYSVVRECMGVEGSLFGFFDQPELVHEILEFFTEFYIKMYSVILEKVNIDYILIWEDMCFKNGPLISPALFAEFCVPYYKRFISKMKSFGVNHFIVDTDGNFNKLIEPFMDIGITGIYPFEVAAGMNVEETREQYPELIIIGGVDKRALAAGKDEILNEVRKIDRMLAKGGYLPCVDHAVTPDVSFKNYTYYRHELNQILKR